MINIVLPSKRKKKPNFFQTNVPDKKHGQPVVGQFFLDEAIRKDKVIKDLIQNLKYKEGDLVNYTNKDGTFTARVSKIARTYAAFGTADWPTSNNPMIVHIINETTGDCFSCTTNYVTPLKQTA